MKTREITDVRFQHKFTVRTPQCASTSAKRVMASVSSPTAPFGDAFSRQTPVRVSATTIANVHCMFRHVAVRMFAACSCALRPRVPVICLVS